MATYVGYTAVSNGSASHVSPQYAKQPYVREVSFNVATFLANNPSVTLAANDVIKLFDVPARTLIMGGGSEVVTAVSSSVATAAVGTTGTSAGRFVAAHDLTSASFGTAAGTAYTPVSTAGSADTAAVTLGATLTGALVTGVIRVWLLLADIS